MYFKIKFHIIIRSIFFCALLFNCSSNLWAEEKGKTIEYEAGFYYTVQKGDTFWGLSEKFSDSAWQWPDLWQENKQVSNPHWIYPGERIRLYLKKGIDNLPQNKNLEQKLQQEQIYYYYSQINQVGFIKKKAVNPSGTILKVKDKKVLINTGDIIYIKKEEGMSLEKGKKYYIYRTMKPVQSESVKYCPGVQHYFTGVVEIMSDEAGFAVGKVVKSFRSINLYDHVMPFEPISPEIAFRGSIKELEGTILFSEEHKVMFAEHDIAFIDKGTKDGIMPGQCYSIFSQDKGKVSANSAHAVLLPPIQYGILLVLRAEADTATILITDSKKSVNAGARICDSLN